MIDISKELNIRLNDVDSEVKASDPMWKKKQKLQIQHLLNPEDKTLIDREKYNDFIQEQLKAKQVSSENGNGFPKAQSNKSLAKYLLKTFIRGIIAIVLFTLTGIFLYFSITYCQKNCKSRKQINREQELIYIRKHQELKEAKQNQFQGSSRL